MFLGEFDVLGLKLAACDHDFIIKEIDSHLRKKQNFLISPLASQTFVIALFDKKLKLVLDQYDYLFSDSLWVKRAINFLYAIGLRERIRGSNFLLQVCDYAQKKKLKVFLYGTTDETLKKLKKNLEKNFPKIQIVDMLPSLFRNISFDEKKKLIQRIEYSKVDLLLTALGSPLEQVFSYNLLYSKPHIKKPMIVIPFGAAFDFTAGVKPVAPICMQNIGLEWLHRFISEPRRLWKRYLLYAPIFVFLIVGQKVRRLFNIGNLVISKSEVGS